MHLTLPMILIVVAGVFTGSLVDAIAGGGGLITLPIYLIAGLPSHLALGTNKFSSTIGTVASTARYIKNGYADFRTAIPAAIVAIICAHFGTKLQLMVSERILQYVLLAVLPIVAIFVLKTKKFPEEPGNISLRKQMAIVIVTSLFVGTYDGFYGPGTGTFLLMVYTMVAKMDVRTASGNVKICNLSSNVSALVTSILAGKVFFTLGIMAACAAVAGHLIGSGLAIKNGSKIVRPLVLVVLLLLVIKVVSGLI